MFFTDREKEIYESPLGTKYDPLRVDHILVIDSGSQLDSWLRDRNAALPDENGQYTGDISASGRATAKVNAARAELELARVARQAFGLPEFPELTDAGALEVLFHFLEWQKGKDLLAGTPPSSPQVPPDVSPYEPTRSSLQSG